MATAIQETTDKVAQIGGIAQARYTRVSPQKARLVIDLIRGRRAEEALHTLQFTKKRVAKDIEKTLRSAIANAERKAEDSGETLDVDELFCERGAALEAYASGADGPRVPLPEAYQPHSGGSFRASPRSGRARGGCGGGSAGFEGCEGRGTQSSQGIGTTQ